MEARPRGFIWSTKAAIQRSGIVQRRVALNETPSSGNSVTPMVIDGDGAFDDIKAVMYLLEEPDVDVLAITMSGTGIGRCPRGAENTSAVLERIDAPEILVACGRTTPLAGDNEAPPEWRAAADEPPTPARPQGTQRRR